MAQGREPRVSIAPGSVEPEFDPTRPLQSPNGVYFNYETGTLEDPYSDNSDIDFYRRIQKSDQYVNDLMNRGALESRTAITENDAASDKVEVKRRTDELASRRTSDSCESATVDTTIDSVKHPTSATDQHTADDPQLILNVSTLRRTDTYSSFRDLQDRFSSTNNYLELDSRALSRLDPRYVGRLRERLDELARERESEKEKFELSRIKCTIGAIIWCTIMLLYAIGLFYFFISLFVEKKI
ncbi:uncharacterized protein LOC106650860 [Trichogramma pretiosum]|uniref:uncharacterized protein LOC106650860 n=1 Tax=Trichogramma pretiosum TaxID=7493 RepID=UPI0006C9CCBF|nr:uncharacterized protein LOC106650860 [Trichogramma pretiosum]